MDVSDYNIALFPSANKALHLNSVDEAQAPKQKRNTKGIGIVSELVAMQHFAAAGFGILLPLGDFAPYDLILDDRRGRLYRIQVKTGRLRRGVVLFNCCSNHGHRNAPPTQYIGMIEAFAIYCPDNGEFYVVPIDAEAVTATSGSLRIAAPINNVRKTIKWAKDYRFDGSTDILRFGVASKGSGAAGED